MTVSDYDPVFGPPLAVTYCLECDEATRYFQGVGWRHVDADGYVLASRHPVSLGKVR